MNCKKGTHKVGKKCVKTERTIIDEEQRKFLKDVHRRVNFWCNNGDEGKEKCTPEKKEKLDSLAFSILTILDGDSVYSPEYDVRPQYPEDGYGSNYAKRRNVNIAGGLHEIYFKRE